MNYSHNEKCGICHTEYCEHIQSEIDKRMENLLPTDINTITLASCPFCGGEAELDGEAQFMTVTIHVTCYECKARIKITGGWNHEKKITEEVVIKWNARKNP